jgi:hypothetical protein
MGQGRVQKNVCGTPMCHGGWYVVACDLNPLEERFYGADYLDGAMAIALALGFPTSYTLELWASDNPKLWGNEYGDDMFCCNSAFNDAKTLRGVVNHWIGVHNRTCPKATAISKIK